MDKNLIINLHKKGLKNTEIAKALRINSLANIKALWREGRRNRPTEVRKTSHGTHEKKDQSRGRKNPKMPKKIYKKNGQGA